MGVNEKGFYMRLTVRDNSFIIVTGAIFCARNDYEILKDRTITLWICIGSSLHYKMYTVSSPQMLRIFIRKGLSVQRM